MLAPHDFLALNEEKQSRDKYGWTYFVRGVMIIRNPCIEYFHTKAQKLQKVLRSKAQENATEGEVELDVWATLLSELYTVLPELYTVSLGVPEDLMRK